jgi:hypothetical protein
MYAFIVGNTNFNFNKNGARNLKENTRLKNLEVEMKEKIEKIKNFDPDSCYNFSEVDDEDESNTGGVSPDMSSRSIVEDHLFSKTDERNNTYQNLKTSVIVENEGTLAKKVYEFKIIIKWMDIIASILIIIGCFLAQVENERFYYDNLSDRSEVMRLMMNLHHKRVEVKNLNLSDYNVSYFSNQTIVEQVNFTDYFNIPINLNISSYCSIMRILIFISTVGSIPLIVVGRYIEYLREYVYTNTIESK